MIATLLHQLPINGKPKTKCGKNKNKSLQITCVDGSDDVGVETVEMIDSI